jgi:Ni,Fe-hydrogenase III large subunit/Ni,Fe-hydrogenase III component G
MMLFALWVERGMKIEDFGFELQPLSGAMPVWHAWVDRAQWSTAAQQVRSHGGRLVALWGADQTDRGGTLEVHMTLTARTGLVWLTLSAATPDAGFPDVSLIFPAANRMQRTVFDLFGLRANDADDARQWLRHAAWPAHAFPLRKSAPARTFFGKGRDDYPFIAVSGDGVHEIPVGPVHAGTIEPGHFRFSVVGERVLRLEERLGYTHKGIEKRFESLSLMEGARLAGRVSGDSTVAYAWAYAMAVEAAAGATPPERACWLRALLLERERIANHLGDLGFIGNDAGLAFALAQCARLKEDVLRLNQTWTGHRYLMDAIAPGGVACDVQPDTAHALREQMGALSAEVKALKEIFDDHPGLQDRLIGTGRVLPELADRLGLCGLAGRASGAAWDLRVQFPCVPYDKLEVHIATHRNGDVAARTTVRFEEVLESLELSFAILDRMPPGEVRTELPMPEDRSLGVGWSEGWRGEVLIALEAGPEGSLRRVHPHDPSWQNWPLLEHAVIGNIVPDFPLINKSFNLSYSGVDL